MLRVLDTETVTPDSQTLPRDGYAAAKSPDCHSDRSLRDFGGLLARVNRESGSPGAHAWDQEAPEELVASRCATSALRFHADTLRALLDRNIPDDQRDARVNYHANWLEHLLAPAGTGCWPTVDVVIPVFNSADSVPRAIDSVLQQTYPAARAVVVDDGSTDDLETALEPYQGRILLLRKENGGCASARNVGIQESRADFIHFLDSDDELDADAIGRKINAMRLIPDAGVCCSSYRCVGDDLHRGAGTHTPTPFRDTLCPTKDLLRCAASRYPFWTSTVLIPRWVLLNTGAMDEDMANGSDMRYWFRLGLDGIKVAALDVALTTRYFRHGSLTSAKAAHRRAWAVNTLRSIQDILLRPNRWPWLGAYARLLLDPERWRWFNDGQDRQILRLTDALGRIITDLPAIGARSGLSSRFPLIVLEHELDRAHRWLDLGRGTLGPFVSILQPRIASALSPSGPLTGCDLRLWVINRKASNGYRDSRRAYDEIFSQLSKMANQPGPKLSTHQWSEVAGWARGAPVIVERRVTGISQKFVGSGAAALLGRVAFFMRRWQLDLADEILGVRSRLQVRGRLGGRVKR